ncbi:hypothetical protein [Chondrinema litorale]|uniref:hypothetical protein n=1 Tax=Chondrinema litorale TaxID=2994555 RepID=UPI0025428FA8|nr:hypothetical protein [Chondrinema litorale]UZR97874.1 hypothetical protein OQ292_29095 [Chondrinema litorale]
MVKKIAFAVIPLSLMLHFVLLFLAKKSDFDEQYQVGINKADQFLMDHQTAIEQLVKAYNLTDEDLYLMFAVVYPELVRFLQAEKKADQLATKLYKVSSDNVLEKWFQPDFSVGCFQMKVSFAEKLDTFFPQESHLPTELDKKVSELKKVDTQLKYLVLFYKTVQDRFPEIETFTLEKRVGFVAVCYNLGFDRSKEDIINYLQAEKKTFPYSRFPLKWYNSWTYAALANKAYRHFKRESLFKFDLSI